MSAGLFYLLFQPERQMSTLRSVSSARLVPSGSTACEETPDSVCVPVSSVHCSCPALSRGSSGNMFFGELLERQTYCFYDGDWGAGSPNVFCESSQSISVLSCLSVDGAGASRPDPGSHCFGTSVTRPDVSLLFPLSLSFPTNGILQALRGWLRLSLILVFQTPFSSPGSPTPSHSGNLHNWFN